jgi:hypothetical protein
MIERFDVGTTRPFVPLERRRHVLVVASGLRPLASDDGNF